MAEGKKAALDAHEPTIKIELRCIEPGNFEAAPEPLNALEQSLRNIATSPWHTITETKTEE